MTESSSVAQTIGMPFTEGLEKGVLRFQSCTACGAPQTLTRYVCTRCGNRQLVWREAAGTGTVYATTMVSRAPSEEFRALAPYLLLLVDLDEGSRVMAHGTPGLKIGDRVRVRIQPIAGRPLPMFYPRDSDTPVFNGNGDTQ